MLRAVNRVLLGLVGVLLLALGLALLLGGLDLASRWGLDLPSAWPWQDPDDVALSDGDRTKWRAEGWWWPVVLAVLAVLAVLLLWWLLAQLRRRRLGEVLVDSGDGAGALLRGRALEDVLAAEAESLKGVGRARVALTGRRSQPGARVGLLLEPHAEPGAAVRQLGAEALEHARASAGLERLPAEVRLRCARHRAERVS
ncbi:alkaline shock response membrane anchor protein AmaP [Streptomyces daliensis]|uniref:Alkaline shock response membrane anchor protein AmaP n=1 Tax=Streptomyces daliensis TaxID=299421 RepID=A0A8T4IPR9_9ACTN|nr:alkaline shock response membrane anchor protein AmaP [Streptomyces daliensis]